MDMSTIVTLVILGVILILVIGSSTKQRSRPKGRPKSLQRAIRSLTTAGSCLLAVGGIMVLRIEVSQPGDKLEALLKILDDVFQFGYIMGFANAAFFLYVEYWGIRGYGYHNLATGERAPWQSEEDFVPIKGERVRANMALGYFLLWAATIMGAFSLAVMSAHQSS